MTAFPHWSLPQDIDTPAVVIDMPRLTANIASMADSLARSEVALRPHVKTHKSVEIARLQLTAGAAGITCATLGEAEVFAASGIDDVFVAFPLWASPSKTARLKRVAERCRLRLGVESIEGARRLGADVPDVDVLIEVDSGELRTGVRTPQAAVAVAAAAADAGLHVRGLFTHGGHSYNSPDSASRAAEDEVRTLTHAAVALERAGHQVDVLSAGSTPTARLSARDDITEERPGTYVFGDRQQVMLGAHRAESVALFVAGTVVSSADGQVVLDAGAKALAKDRHPLVDGFGALPAYPDAVVSRLYDHHAVVELRGGRGPRLGEIVAIVVNHVCPVVNLAETLHILDGERIVDRWPVDARARNA